MKFTFWGVFYLAIFLFACQNPPAKTAENAGNDRNSTGGATTTAPDGLAVFRKNCVICHGADGKLGANGAKDLSASALPLEGRIQTITNGRNLMTPFKAILSEEEIKAVAAYTMTLKKSNG